MVQNGLHSPITSCQPSMAAKLLLTVGKKFSIFEEITDGSSALSSIDPLQAIAPLPSTYDGGKEIVYPVEVNEDFVNLLLATEDDSDWGNEEDDEFDRNAFEFIADDEWLFGSLCLMS